MKSAFTSMALAIAPLDCAAQRATVSSTQESRDPFAAACYRPGTTPAAGQHGSGSAGVI
jgi:hypothetical protein